MPEQKERTHTQNKNTCTPTKELKRRINNNEQYSMPWYYIAHMKSWNTKTLYSMGTFALMRIANVFSFWILAFDETISSVIHIRLEYFIYFCDAKKKLMLESMKNGLCILDASLLCSKREFAALLTEFTMTRPHI